nr:hypothetical protein [uncultured Duganella sp.]
MPIKTIDGYEVDYTAEPLEGCDDWGAYVAIFAPSDNPMHMNNIVPKRRVAADVSLTSEEMAEQEAEKAAMAMLKELSAAS